MRLPSRKYRRWNQAECIWNQCTKSNGFHQNIAAGWRRGNNPNSTAHTCVAKLMFSARQNLRTPWSATSRSSSESIYWSRSWPPSIASVHCAGGWLATAREQQHVMYHDIIHDIIYVIIPWYLFIMISYTMSIMSCVWYCLWYHTMISYVISCIIHDISYII